MRTENGFEVTCKLCGVKIESGHLMLEGTVQLQLPIPQQDERLPAEVEQTIETAGQEVKRWMYRQVMRELDAELDAELPNKHDVPVKAGQRVELGVAGVPLAPVAVDYLWSLMGTGTSDGGDFVKDFDPTKTTNQVTQLAFPDDYSRDEFDFVWVAGGSDRWANVNVTVGAVGVGLIGYFDVIRPEDTVIADANNWTSANGKNGVNTATDPNTGKGLVVFGGVDSYGSAVDGMTFSSFAQEVFTNLGFQACFCQVVNHFWYQRFDAYNNTLGLQDDKATNKLDNGFPYESGFSAVDSPRARDIDPAFFRNGESLYASYSFTMWHMCEPTACDAIWIPLEELTWTLTWRLEYDAQNSVFVVSSASHSPTISAMFADTTRFPTWNGVIQNGVA
jgi:hypothetical protein